MRLPLSTLLLALSFPAHALTTHQVGTWIDVAGGLAPDTSPGAHLGWQASVGSWFGPYDNAYAIGRYHGLGLTLRQDLVPDDLRSGLELEYRRGMDIIVVGLYGYAAAGAQLVDQQAGATAHLGAGTRLRFLPHYSLTLRLDLGIGTAPQLHGSVGLVLGFGWTRPWAGVDELGLGIELD